MKSFQFHECSPNVWKSILKWWKVVQCVAKLFLNIQLDNCVHLETKSCRKRFVCSTWRRCIGEFASKSLRYCSGSRLNGIAAIPVAGADLRSWSREAQPRVRLRQISLHSELWFCFCRSSTVFKAAVTSRSCFSMDSSWPQSTACLHVVAQILGGWVVRDDRPECEHLEGASSPKTLS